jgi:hypothetical protein
MRDVSKLTLIERRNIAKVGDVVTVQLFNCKTFETLVKTVTIAKMGHKFFYDNEKSSYYWDELKEIQNA